MCVLSAWRLARMSGCALAGNTKSTLLQLGHCGALSDKILPCRFCLLPTWADLFWGSGIGAADEVSWAVAGESSNVGIG